MILEEEKLNLWLNAFEYWIRAIIADSKSQYIEDALALIKARANLIEVIEKISK